MIQDILLRVQKNFPLNSKPFDIIANELGIKEQEVISIIQTQKDEKIIRQTSAIFDTKSLGYKSSLIAFEIDEDKIDNAVEIINAHPGVSHNYERNHKFNIWFTMAVSPQTKLGLDKTIEILAKLTKANDFIMLPTLKLFKISVKLDTTGKEAKKEKDNANKLYLWKEKLINLEKGFIVKTHEYDEAQKQKEEYKNLILNNLGKISKNLIYK